jgi:hypothetical protein
MRPEVISHHSGLKVQAVTGPRVRLLHSHVVQLPACCPRSGNPLAGSTLCLTYYSSGWCLEVYSLRALLKRFVGGWKGTDAYPAERNMEGMIALLGQMSADALNEPVRFTANLILDVGPLVLRGRATP